MHYTYIHSFQLFWACWKQVIFIVCRIIASWGWFALGYYSLSFISNAGFMPLSSLLDKSGYCTSLVLATMFPISTWGGELLFSKICCPLILWYFSSLTWKNWLIWNHSFDTWLWVCLNKCIRFSMTCRAEASWLIQWKIFPLLLIQIDMILFWFDFKLTHLQNIFSINVP